MIPVTAAKQGKASSSIPSSRGSDPEGDAKNNNHMADKVASSSSLVGTTMAETSCIAKIKGLVSQNKAEEALQVLEESLQEKKEVLDLSVYNEVFGCAVVNSEWSLALEVLKHIVTDLGLTPTLDTYKAGLDACLKARNYSQAIKLYEAMLTAKVEPDGRAIEAVLKALTQTGQKDRALEILRDAQTKFGLAPTKYMYRIVLGSLFQGSSKKHARGASNNPVELRQTLQSVFKQEHRLTEGAAVFLVEDAFRMRHRRLNLVTVEPILQLFLRDAALKPTSFSEQAYLAVISLCKTTNALDYAVKILDLMATAQRGTVLAFNMVLKLCEKNRHPQKALRLLKEMEKSMLIPDIVTYNTVISACAKGHLPRESQRLLQEMEERYEIAPNIVSFNSVIDGLALEGLWKEALAIMGVIKRRGMKPDVITFTGLIQACSKGRQVAKALSFMEAMKLEGVKPDAVAYSAAIEACARGGMAQKALELYHELREVGFEPQPQIYRALVHACGEEESGGQEVEKVWSMLQLCPPELRNNFVYSAALKVCDRAQHWEMAMRLLDDAQSIGLVPDDITYGHLLHVLSSCGRWEEATRILSSIKRRNVRHYTSAIRACSPEKPEQAMVIYKDMMLKDGITPDLYVYNVLLQSLRALAAASSTTSKERNVAATQALEIYYEMLEASLQPDIVSLTVLISILENCGRHEEALRCFADGVRMKVLMSTNLDSLWERDLSRLSYQLVRSAIDYSLDEILTEYQKQKKAAAGTKEPNVEELVLITGVDGSGGLRRGMKKNTGTVSSVAGGKTDRGKMLSSSSVNNEKSGTAGTRQELAVQIFAEKGLDAMVDEDHPGILKIGKESLRNWLSAQILSLHGKKNNSNKKKM